MVDILAILKQILAKRGRGGQFIERQSQLMYEWKAWYQGYVKEFHKYTIPTGQGDLVEKVKMYLSMAKRSCEDYANLLLNEKCDIVIPEQPKKILDAILNETQFWSKGNALVEKTFALGNGAFVENVVDLIVNENGIIVDKSKAKITISTIDAEKIYPITFDDGKMVEVAFVYDNTTEIIFQIHLIDKQEYLEDGRINPNFGNYDIITEVYEKNAINLNVKNLPDKSYTFQTGSPIAWFQAIKPNIVNNIDIDSPLGISSFANAISSLQSIDNTYDSLNNEIELGRKRIVASTEMINVDPTTGKNVNAFDPKDIVFYKISKNSVDDKPLFQEVNGELRVDQIVNALNWQLNIFSSKIGLGNNYYKFTQEQGIQTATAVVSQYSDLFRSIKKHEIVLENALRNLTKAIIYISNEFTNTPLGNIDDEDITIQFDDSIIEDKEAQKLSDRQDLLNGTMSKVEYRMKWYGEDEDTAIKNLAKFTTNGIDTKINALLAALQSKAITPSMFVQIVYGDLVNEKQKTELINYINDSFQSQNGIDASMLNNFGF